MTTLTRSTTVLVLSESDDETVGYVPDEDPVGGPALILSREDYADMGSPQTVTVTVQPGDRLNEGDTDPDG